MKYLGPEETVKLMVWNNTDPSFSLRLIDFSYLFVYFDHIVYQAGYSYFSYFDWLHI